MAAMELRVAPPGVDGHVHRGVQNFVRLRRGSIIHAAVNNYTWTADPDDGNTPCVPYHIVEGLYAWLIEAAADVAAADIQFGHSRLGIEILLAAEASLSSEFDSSSCGIDGFVRRVEVEAARPHLRAPTDVILTFSFVAALPIAAPAHSSQHDDSEPAPSREHVVP